MAMRPQSPRPGGLARLSAWFLPLLVVVGFLVLSSLFVVDARQRALVTRFGEVIRVLNEPGLSFKLPLIDSVLYYDKRILSLKTRPLEVTPLDDRRLIVDAFARWRISDVVEFREAVGDSGEQGAQDRIQPIIVNAIRAVLGSVPSTAVLTDDRTVLMNRIRDQARTSAAALGVEVIDVRLTRTDLPDQNLDATFARMRAERQREAADERARGAEAAQRVRAAADRTVVELTSEARRNAEIIRGQADARRNAIYAGAYGRDPEFFAFNRSLQAYVNSMQGDNSSVVMAPDGEFFDYFASDGSGSAPAPNLTPATAPAEEGGQEEAEEAPAEGEEAPEADAAAAPPGDSASQLPAQVEQTGGPLVPVAEPPAAPMGSTAGVAPDDDADPDATATN